MKLQGELCPECLPALRRRTHSSCPRCGLTERAIYNINQYEASAHYNKIRTAAVEEGHRATAVYRIKNLRDQFDRQAGELLRRTHPRLHDAVVRDQAFGSAYTYFVCELNELIDRIERDEEVTS